MYSQTIIFVYDVSEGRNKQPDGPTTKQKKVGTDEIPWATVVMPLDFFMNRQSSIFSYLTKNTANMATFVYC